MSGTYRAWNGKTYRWPPPDGWYRASDGRWWAPGSGPNPPTRPRPHVDRPSPTSKARRQPRPDRASERPDEPETETDPVAAQADAVDTGPLPRRTWRTSRLAAIAAGVVLAAMTGGAIVGLLATTDAFGHGSGNRIDTVAASTTSMTTDGSTGTGSRTESAAGPSTTDGGPAASTAESSSATTISESRMGTVSSTTTGHGDPATSEPRSTGDPAGRVARFRQLVTADGLASDPLTDRDVEDLAEALCVIAIAEDTTGFLAARSQIAADQAAGSTLSAEQLSGTINAAVLAFCPDDATRLGL